MEHTVWLAPQDGRVGYQACRVRFLTLPYHTKSLLCHVRCQRCRERRSYCSKDRPKCTRCQSSNLDCVYKEGRNITVSEAYVYRQ